MSKTLVIEIEEEEVYIILKDDNNGLETPISFDVEFTPKTRTYFCLCFGETILFQQYDSIMIHYKS